MTRRDFRDMVLLLPVAIVVALLLWAGFTYVFTVAG